MWQWTALQLSRSKQATTQCLLVSGFNPGVDWDTLDYSKSPAIQNMPVTSQICEPDNGTKVKVRADGTVKVKGYAYSGGGNRIIRVDLTADGGKTWFEGTIDQQDTVKEPRHYGWTVWSANVKVIPVGILSDL